jgi:hypothetical protein
MSKPGFVSSKRNAQMTLFGATNNTPVTTKEKEVELEKLWGWLNSG